MGYGYTGNYGTGFYKGQVQGASYPQNFINYETGVCLRLGLKPEHGQGWCYYSNGIHWLWPEPEVRPIEVEDANKQIRSLILDERAGRFYEWPTKNGPTGSGLTASWLDKEDVYGGAEIPTDVEFRELIGTKECQKLEHQESHLYLRPQIPENQGASGHTSSGMRNAQEIDYKQWVDGSLAINNVTKNIQQNGELVYDHHKVGRRIKNGFSTTTSEYKLASMDITLNQKDEAGSRSEKKMNEAIWQEEYAEPLFWISRGYNPMVNRATANDCAGSYLTQTDGPDSNTDSAISLSPADFISSTIADLAGDFTIQFSIKDVIYGADLITFSVGALQIGILYDPIAGDTAIQFTDGVNLFAQNLSWANDRWIVLKITRSGNELLISKDGVLLNTFSLASIVTYGGTIQFNNGDSFTLFDARVNGKAISNEAFLYYYENINADKGNALLPV